MTKQKAIKKFEKRYFSKRTTEFYKVKKHRTSSSGPHYFEVIAVDITWHNRHFIQEDILDDKALSSMKEISEEEFKKQADKVYNEMINN